MRTAFDEIMAVRGKGAPLANEVSIVNQDPVLESRFRLGETCAAALAGVGVAVNDICCRLQPATTRPDTSRPLACWSPWPGVRSRAAAGMFGSRCVRPGCSSIDRACSSRRRPDSTSHPPNSMPFGSRAPRRILDHCATLARSSGCRRRRRTGHDRRPGWAVTPPSGSTRDLDLMTSACNQP